MISDIASPVETRAPVRIGASPEDWSRAAHNLLVSSDLLPIVADQLLPTAPGSALGGKVGKVPSRINSRGQVAGFGEWPNHQSTDAEIARWSADGRYSMGVQTRSIRALDIDLGDAMLVQEVVDIFQAAVGVECPARGRANSAKRLLVFRVRGDVRKQVIRIGREQIELLGNRQQFVAAGTHPSGARYRWDTDDGGVPSAVPTISDEQLVRGWTALAERFGQVVDPAAVFTNGRVSLAFPSRMRGDFNARHSVPELLERYGYEQDDRGKRWAPPNATGAPSIREIAGRDGLWQSDHGSDLLQGTFDAWVVYVQLGYGGNLAAAEAAWSEESATTAEGLDAIPDEEVAGDADVDLTAEGDSFEATELLMADIEAAPDARALVRDICARIAGHTTLDKASRGLLAKAVQARANTLGRKYAMPECHQLVAPRKAEKGVEPDTHAGFARGLIAHLQDGAGGLAPIGADGVLYVPATGGVWAPVTIEALAIKVAEQYDGRDLCKRASDYHAVAKLAYSTVEDASFFTGAPVGLATPSGFYRVDGPRGVVCEPLSHAHRQRFVHGASPAVGDMPEFTRFLSDCFRGEEPSVETAQTDFMQEVAGAVALGLMARHQKVVLLYGPGRSGKGTMAQVLEALVPSDGRCSVSPFLWDREYYLANLAGRRFNVVGELPDSVPIPAAAFKTVTGLDLLSGRQPSGRVFSFRNEAAHVFSSNHYVNTGDRSEAFFTRWLIIGFPNSRIGRGNLDTGLAERIVAQELPAILAWSLEGARRLLQRGVFMPTATHEGHMAAWRRRTDAVMEFLHDEDACELDNYGFGAAGGFEVRRRDLFDAYCHWCARSGRRAVGLEKFGETLSSPAAAALGIGVGRTAARRAVTGVKLLGDMFGPL